MLDRVYVVRETSRTMDQDDVGWEASGHIEDTETKHIITKIQSYTHFYPYTKVTGFLSVCLCVCTEGSR